MKTMSNFRGALWFFLSTLLWLWFYAFLGYDIEQLMTLLKFVFRKIMTGLMYIGKAHTKKATVQSFDNLDHHYGLLFIVVDEISFVVNIQENFRAIILFVWMFNKSHYCCCCRCLHIILFDVFKTDALCWWPFSHIEFYKSILFDTVMSLSGSEWIQMKWIENCLLYEDVKLFLFWHLRDLINVVFMIKIQ